VSALKNALRWSYVSLKLSLIAPILGCVSLTAVSVVPIAAHAESKPAWVSQRPRRPDYYIGVGFAANTGKPEQDRKRAEQSAINALAKEVRVQVKSRFTDRMRAENKNGKQESSQEVESFIETTVSEVLPGVEVEARWHDEKAKEYWAYAVLLKRKVNIEPLSLTVEAIGRRKIGAELIDVVVKNDNILKSRDNLKISFEVSDTAFVYALLYDSQGQANLIFPNAEINLSNKVKGGVRYQIPTGDNWFWLDDHTGRETIYVVASRRPMPEIAQLLGKMEMAGGSSDKIHVSKQIKRAVKVLTRGIGGISKSRKQSYSVGKGKKVKRVSKVVTGMGKAVRIISFQHR
jgi:hypothetical protein